MCVIVTATTSEEEEGEGGDRNSFVCLILGEDSHATPIDLYCTPKNGRAAGGGGGAENRIEHSFTGVYLFLEKREILGGRDFCHAQQNTLRLKNKTHTHSI